MPRGRLPTGIVLMTSSFSLSMTLMVLSFSFETKTLCASALPAAPQSAAAATAMVKASVGLLTSKLLGSNCLMRFLIAGLFGEGGTLRFGFVIAQSVELGELMQETLLRRYRDEELWRCDEDGLTQLAIPCTERQLLALERREIEIRGFHVR